MKKSQVWELNRLPISRLGNSYSDFNSECYRNCMHGARAYSLCSLSIQRTESKGDRSMSERTVYELQEIVEDLQTRVAALETKVSMLERKERAKR